MGEEGESTPALMSPTVVKDDMNFAELCENLKDYCRAVFFSSRFLLFL